MNILFLTPFLPYPPAGGNRMPAYHLLRTLGTRHRVHLVSFIDDENEKCHAGHLRQFCASVTTVVRRVKSGLMPRAANLFDGTRPYFLGHQFSTAEMRAAIKDICSRNSFDIVHANTMAMGQYVDVMSGKGLVLNAVDSSTRNYWQQWHSPLGFRGRATSFIDWLKIRLWEPALYRRFDKVMLVSSVDAAYMHTHCGALPIATVPLGIDTETLQPIEIAEDAMEMVFVGFLNYIPNDDALRYFCADILPKIRARLPAAKLTIVGRGATPALQTIAARTPGVAFAGFVDDIRVPLSRAPVFVCPLRMGTGVKNKVMEAMAMRRAVVTTTIGAEGIAAKPGCDFLRADDAQSFANAVVTLLSDPVLRATLGSSARASMIAAHRMEAVAERTEAVYRDVLAGKGPHAT